MADSFVALASYRTVQVLAGNTVSDVEMVTCSTIPTGITFSYAIPYESWQAGDGGGLLNVIAVQLEELVNGNHVVGGTDGTDLDNNNLLTAYVDLTVSYDRTAQGLPPLYGTATVPIDNFFAQETGIGGFTIPGVASPASIVAAEYSHLAALAGADG